MSKRGHKTHWDRKQAIKQAGPITPEGLRVRDVYILKHFVFRHRANLYNETLKKIK